MYTDEMAEAFHAITPPNGFSVDLYDNGHFITIVVDPKTIVGISEEYGQEIVTYINSVKKALESFGALVLVSRDEVSE
jgi:hypothetical protein